MRSATCSYIWLRRWRALFLVAVIGIAGCSEEKPRINVPPDVQVSYQAAMSDGELESIQLGPESRRSFLDLVNGPEHDFDPKFLKLSAEMGYFKAGELTFEYHHGLVVLNRDDHVYIWTSDWVEKLMPLAVEAYEDPTGLKTFLQQ